jgi:hypothetical protein
VRPLPRAILGVALWLLAAPSRAEPALAYELGSLPETVRGSALEGVQQQLGIAALSDLPLYEVELAVDDVSGTFEGKAVLHYRNLTGRPLQALPLLMHANAASELAGPRGASLSSLTLSEASAEAGPAVELKVRRPTLAELVLSPALAPGARLRVRLRWSGTLRPLTEAANDLYAQALASMGAVGPGAVPDYGLLAKGDGIATLASPLPLVAPRRGALFATERPSAIGDLQTHEVANFRLKLVLPRGVRASTNLVPEAVPAPEPAGAQVLMAAGALRRDLVIVLGRDLQQASARVGKVVVTSTFLSRDAKAGREALVAAQACLTVYERLFGDYPYPRLEIAEASLVGGAGGAEFSGLVLVAGMLYRPPEQSQSPLAQMMKLMGSLSRQLDLAGGEGTGTAQQGAAREVTRMMQAMLRFTVAHEVGHQYFATLIGNDSLKDAALDEPLAQYAAARFVEEAEGKKAAEEALRANVRLNYAIYRALGGVDGAAARPTLAFRSPMEYAALVYGKAPYFYLELRKRLGDARFDRALRLTVASQRFRRVSLAQWLEALETAAGPGSGVKALGQRWLFEARGDEDLGVEADGDEVVRQIFGDEVAAQLAQALEPAGMSPRDLLRTLLGAGLGDATHAAEGPGIDPARALEGLGRQ